jgi:hypothetical protein
MKTATYLAVFVSLVAVPFAPAMTPTQHDIDKGKPKLTMNFPHWETYTDIEDGGWDDPGKKPHILEELRRTFYDLAGDNIPKGEHLTLTFTDIELAGKYNVGRPGRDYRSIFPPRLVFSYVLTGPDGQVLKSGYEHLRDNFYLEKRLISFQRTDPRYYERTLLYEWMKNTLLH